MNMITPQLQAAHGATTHLQALTTDQRVALVHSIADAIEAHSTDICTANAKDCKAMGQANPMYDRLLLTPERIAASAADVRNVATLPDPTGQIITDKTLPNGLHIQQRRVALGVVGMIYESRPNVTIDVAALCLRSGNVAVLRGGSDAEHSNIAIVNVIQSVLRAHNLPEACITLLPTDRKHVAELLTADAYVDIIIPRGSQRLIDFVRKTATVPTIETGAGVCHTYVHTSADLQQAAAICVNAKVSRPSVCNCLDTILVDDSVASTFLPLLVDGMAAAKVEIYADDVAHSVLQKAAYPYLKTANDDQWATEYLSFACGLRVVADAIEAMAHIRKYSSKHSEAICATAPKTIEQYLNSVDAAAVYANASTRFTDGGCFGLGAEIGISTQKLHARGPFALEALTTQKWIVRGTGQTR